MPWTNRVRIRAYQSRWMKAKQHRWRAHGCCVACGLPAGTNPDTGKPFARCFAHRLKASEGQRRWHQRRRSEVAA